MTFSLLRTYSDENVFVPPPFFFYQFLLLFLSHLHPSLALIPALRWQPQAHLMHQLSGQDSSLAGGWKSEISHRLNILTWNLCWWWLPLPFSDPSVASLLERSPPTSAWLRSCCGLLSLSVSLSLSFNNSHSLTVPVFVQKTSGSPLPQNEILQTLAPFVSAIQQSSLSQQGKRFFFLKKKKRNGLIALISEIMIVQALFKR